MLETCFLRVQVRYLACYLLTAGIGIYAPFRWSKCPVHTPASNGRTAAPTGAFIWGLGLSSQQAEFLNLSGIQIEEIV